MVMNCEVHINDEENEKNSIFKRIIFTVLKSVYTLELFQFPVHKEYKRQNNLVECRRTSLKSNRFFWLLQIKF